MTKHTPGPWTSRRFDECQTVILPVAIDRQPPICTVSVGAERPDGEANARLISKAWLLPDLIEALWYWLPDEAWIDEEEAKVAATPDLRERWHSALSLLQRYEESDR